MTSQMSGQFAPLNGAPLQFMRARMTACRATPTKRAQPGPGRADLPCRSASRASSTSFFMPVFSRMRAR